MFRGAGLLACAFGCAAAPAAELPTPAPLGRPVPAVAAAIAPACLPDAAATHVSLLDADLHAIHVCFATACFTIDRRTSAILPLTPPAVLAPPRVSRHLQPIHFEKEREHATSVCSPTECNLVLDRDTELLAGGREDARNHVMVVTVGGDGVAPARFFLVGEDLILHALSGSAGGPCAEATWLDDDILVNSDDCEGGAASGVLYAPNGRRLAPIGLDRALDTHGAVLRRRADTLAILTPRSYALVLADSLAQHQSVIDLVPIQAESTPDPYFELAPLGDHEWLVASATGGIGVVDQRTMSLTKTWIIPRCEASP